MTRFHCLSCGDLRTIEIEHGVYAQGHNEYCLGGRVIPIATLCSEPTVIDESDLAPGMVVVAVDDFRDFVNDVWVATPDACLGGLSGGLMVATRKRSTNLVTVDDIRRIAGKVTP